MLPAPRRSPTLPRSVLRRRRTVALCTEGSEGEHLGDRPRLWSKLGSEARAKGFSSPFSLTVASADEHWDQTSSTKTGPRRPFAIKAVISNPDSSVAEVIYLITFDTIAPRVILVKHEHAQSDLRFDLLENGPVTRAAKPERLAR